MPTYDYACEKCGHQFEFYQSMKDDPIQVCPKEKCAKARWGKGKVQRQLGTGAGLIFKGSGFYTTDYRSESYKAGAKKDKESAAPKKESDTTAKKSKGSSSKNSGSSSSKS